MTSWRHARPVLAHVCAGRLLVAAARRGGGFHRHRESGGDIVALHRPGFTVGGPNYEREVFDAIRVTNGVAPASDPSAYRAPPALESPPKVRRLAPASAARPASSRVGHAQPDKGARGGLGGHL